MAYEVFISHSTKDKIAADAVVAHLERSGLRCWCAPRDIVPGASWAKSIVQAISECRVMVVIFSANANSSDHIRREVEAAVRHGTAVIPLRIENVLPQGDLEYFLSSSHWMDAVSAPLERHFDQLAQQLRALINVGSTPHPSVPQPPAGPLNAPSPQAKRAGGKAVLIGGVVAVLAIGGISLTYWLHGSKHSVPSGPDAMATVPPPVNPTPVNPSPVSVVSPAPALPPPASPVVEAAPVSPSKDAAVPDPSVEQDYQAWQVQALVHYDNSFVQMTGPKRYAAWRRAADAGDPVGQFFVGYCYAQGAGVAEDDAAANDWLTRAANAGNTDAMAQLGTRYLLGLGTPVNPSLWFNWTSKAAQANNVGAMAGLGGVGFGQTDAVLKAEGKRWMDKACVHGSLDAQVFTACTAGLSAADLAARLQKPAEQGQPEAVLMLANAHPTDPVCLAAAQRAIEIYGNPIPVQNLIDPPPMFLMNSSGAFTRMAWKRLHEMADGGFTDAAKSLTFLKGDGMTDPTVAH